LSLCRPARPATFYKRPCHGRGSPCCATDACHSCTLIIAHFRNHSLSEKATACAKAQNPSCISPQARVVSISPRLNGSLMHAIHRLDHPSILSGACIKHFSRSSSHSSTSGGTSMECTRSHRARLYQPSPRLNQIAANCL
jgi:hypothetical protein